MTNQIQWKYFPSNKILPDHLAKFILVFEKAYDQIDSYSHSLRSNEVAKILINTSNLYELDLSLKTHRIDIPFQFGQNGKVKNSFKADLFDLYSGTVFRIEAGRAYTNNQFLKNIVDCMLIDSVHYVVISVSKQYRNHLDYDRIIEYCDLIYSRLNGCFNKNMLIIGY